MNDILYFINKKHHSVERYSLMMIDPPQMWMIFQIRYIAAVIKMVITKHVYIILTPINFYIVKLRFTGIYIIFFLFLLKNIDCGYSLEPPRRGGSNEYP